MQIIKIIALLLLASSVNASVLWSDSLSVICDDTRGIIVNKNLKVPVPDGIISFFVISKTFVKAQVSIIEGEGSKNRCEEYQITSGLDLISHHNKYGEDCNSIEIEKGIVLKWYYSDSLYKKYNNFEVWGHKVMGHEQNAILKVSYSEGYPLLVQHWNGISGKLNENLFAIDKNAGVTWSMGNVGDFFQVDSQLYVTKRGINDRVFRYIICNSIPVFKDSLTNLSYPSFYPNFGKNSILQYSGSDEKKMCYD